MLPGFFHDTLGEKDRAHRDRQGARFHPRPLRRSPRHRSSLLDADRIGYTRDEADRLASPLPAAVAARALLGGERG